MSDIINIADQIYQCKEKLDKMKPEIKVRATKRAETIANYDKTIAVTLIRLKNGYDFEIDGQKVSNPPATYTDKIA